MLWRMGPVRRTVVPVEDVSLRRAVDDLLSRPPPPATKFPQLDPALRPALTWGALHHPDPPARRLCLDYLDHLAGPEAAGTFTAALADPVPRVRRHAIHALTCEACKPGAWCADAVTPLRQIIRHDPNPKVRFEALRALLSQLDPPARAATIQAVLDPADLPLLRAAVRARRRSVPADLRAHAEQTLQAAGS